MDGIAQDESLQKKVGARVRLARMRLGMKQKDLTEKSGLPQRFVSRLETGEFFQIDLVKFVKIAKILNVSMDHLLLGNEEENRNS